MSLNPTIFIYILHVIKYVLPHFRQCGSRIINRIQIIVQLLGLVDSAMQIKNEFTTSAKDLHYNIFASSYLKLTFPFHLEKAM